MLLDKRQKLFTNAIQERLIHCVADYMPPSAYRNFALWLLSTPLPYRTEWLQLIGVYQIVQLNLALFDGVVEDANWEQLAYVCQPLNTYFIFEAMSDDLALYLVNYCKDDPDAPMRAQLLNQFNTFMMDRLKGDKRPAHKLLAHPKKKAGRSPLSRIDIPCRGYYISIPPMPPMPPPGAP